MTGKFGSPGAGHWTRALAARTGVVRRYEQSLRPVNEQSPAFETRIWRGRGAKGFAIINTGAQVSILDLMDCRPIDYIKINN